MRRIRSTIVTAVLAALVVFVLLLPWSGNDSEPPECFSVFGYVVPCGPGPDQQHGEGFALAGSAVAAALVGVGSAVGRREAASDRAKEH
ncbi:MAG: hypothetical protein WEB55_06685 [Acidimicrobiia bacterium]